MRESQGSRAQGFSGGGYELKVQRSKLEIQQKQFACIYSQQDRCLVILNQTINWANQSIPGKIFVRIYEKVVINMR